MKRFDIKVNRPIIGFIIIAFIWLISSTGCGKSGAIKDPVSYVTPSIQNLQTQSTNIAKCTGGILAFTFDWTSPKVVSTASAYLSFVKTIDLPVTEPIGVIGSATEMITNSSLRASAVITNEKLPLYYDLKEYGLKLDNATSSINNPQAIIDFYKKYEKPILIPVKISTEETSGQFFAQIPFTPNDIASAPLGIHQMMVYMNINGYKTNTLAFELTFVP